MRTARNLIIGALLSLPAAGAIAPAVATATATTPVAAVAAAPQVFYHT